MSLAEGGPQGSSGGRPPLPEEPSGSGSLGRLPGSIRRQLPGVPYVMEGVSQSMPGNLELARQVCT